MKNIVFHEIFSLCSFEFGSFSSPDVSDIKLSTALKCHQQLLCYPFRVRWSVSLETNVTGEGGGDDAAELQKSHGYAGITREEGLQNGQSVRKVSCQHTT